LRRTVRRGFSGVRQPAGLVEALEDRTLLATFTLTSDLDTPDDMPGDGLAEDSMGRTTLRAAMQEAEALAGPDSIVIPFAGTIMIGTPFTVTDDVSISGLGAPFMTLDSGGVGRHFLIFSATVSITGVTLTRGYSGDALGGSAIANFGGDLTVRNVRITDNGTPTTGGLFEPGGGINFGSDFTMGGAPGTLTIVDSLIDGNVGSAGGGVVIGNSAGPARIFNSTITGNDAAVGDGGGVHFTQNDNSLEIRNSTMTGNRVLPDAPGTQIGGGIYVASFPGGGDPLPMLFNTILAGNTSGTMTVVPDDVDGTVSGSGGGPLLDPGSAFNLIGDAGTSGGLTDGVLGNIVGLGGAGTRPIGTILASLADNGGPTMTHALVTDSVAVDAGSNLEAVGIAGAPLLNDQRGPGFGRVINGDADGSAIVDMGAFEAPPGTSGGSGDGFDDIVARSAGGSVGILVSDGTKFSSLPSGVVLPTVDWDEFLTGDFNGDGLTDWAGRSPSDGMWRVKLATGSGFTPPMLWGTWTTIVPFSDLVVGDFNADGLDDVAGRADTGTWLVGLSDGTKFVSTAWGAWSATATWINVLVGDFNGDGLDDLAGRNSLNTWIVSLAGASTFTTSVWGAWSSSVTWADVNVGDFNRDGRSDILGRASTGSWVAGLSSGTMFIGDAFGAWSTTAGFTDVMVGDFNGDGFTDVVGRSAKGRVVVGLSDGDKFVSTGWAIWSTAVTWLQVVLGDFTGDGFLDIAGRSSTGTWIVGASTGTKFVTTVWGSLTPATTWNNVSAGRFT
jgi:hypothetical protein